MADIANVGAAVITNERYEQLLDLETRVNVVIERIAHKNFLSSEDLMWLLGTKESVKLAQILMAEAEAESKAYTEKYGNAESEV